MNEFIPYGRQYIDSDDINAVVSTLQSDFLTQGPVVPRFENKISELTNSKYTVVVNSATSALHLSCLALGVGPSDIVWTSPITFVASANCALYCGANVDFVDIDPLTGLMSIAALELKLEQAALLGALPKVVIPVHLAGTSCDMHQIYRLSKIYNFKIIEDASHAIGGFYHSHPVGSCMFSDITVFSFHPVKIITTGEGGALTTNNESYFHSACSLRTHGITKDQASFQYSSPGPWYYEQQLLGFNYRLPDINAALGLSQISRLSSNIQRRQFIFSQYKLLLADLPIHFLDIPFNILSSLHLAVMQLNFIDPVFHKNLFNILRSNKIGVQLHYYPVHLQPYFRNLGFKVGDFPAAEKYSISSISLPIFPELCETSQLRVCDVISGQF